MTLVDDRYHRNTPGVVRETLSLGLRRNCGWAAFVLLAWMMGRRRQVDLRFLLILGLL